MSSADQTKGFEKGKLPGSAPCSTPCSAHNEILKVKITQLLEKLPAGLAQNPHRDICSLLCIFVR